MAIPSRISRRHAVQTSSRRGLALGLLLGVTLMTLLLQPPLIVRASLLAFVVLFFLAMRHRIGNWIQARFFMTTDFEEVSLRDVREVQARRWERRPVHFIATIVRAKARDGL